jgi:hypothetical protein
MGRSREEPRYLGRLVVAGHLDGRRGRAGGAVGRQRHLPARRPHRLGAAAAGVRVLRRGGRPDRGPPSRERRRLELRRDRPAGGARGPGRGVRHLRLRLPPARRGPGRLVRLLGLVPDHRPGAAVHPAAVPRRPAAVAALVAPGLAGRGDHGGVRRAGRRPADPRAGRRQGGQPDRGGLGRQPRAQYGRPGPARPERGAGRGRGGVAGRPVPPLAGRGAPPAQVVHLRLRPPAPGRARRPAARRGRQPAVRRHRVPSCPSPPGWRSCATACTRSTG